MKPLYLQMWFGINNILTMRVLSALPVDFLCLPSLGLPPGLNSVSRSFSKSETEDMPEGMAMARGSAAVLSPSDRSSALGSLAHHLSSWSH